MFRFSEFYSNNPTNDLVEWKPGDYCVAKFTDNMYYRARIINVPQSGKKLYVFFFYSSRSSRKDTKL